MVEVPTPTHSTVTIASDVIEEPQTPNSGMNSAFEAVAAPSSTDVAQHSATSIDEHQTDIASDINMFENDLFKAFDEYEKNQRMLFEDIYPEYNVKPNDQYILDNSPSASYDEEIRRLKAQVATLEMEKEELTKQLEYVNLRCTDLEHQVLSIQSKDTQSLLDPVEVEYVRAIAIENEIDAKILALQTFNQDSRDSLNKMIVALEQPLNIKNNQANVAYERENDLFEDLEGPSSEAALFPTVMESMECLNTPPDISQQSIVHDEALHGDIHCFDAAYDNATDPNLRSETKSRDALDFSENSFE
ncbi:hypothetical protein AC1031_021348 [Aphanomyces cochlioides]|nr:hypothetical protein AC1031_021348 [Aphanomyces cochlioides]